MDKNSSRISLPETFSGENFFLFSFRISEGSENSRDRINREPKMFSPPPTRGLFASQPFRLDTTPSRFQRPTPMSMSTVMPTVTPMSSSSNYSMARRDQSYFEPGPRTYRTRRPSNLGGIGFGIPVNNRSAGEYSDQNPEESFGTSAVRGFGPG